MELKGNIFYNVTLSFWTNGTKPHNRVVDAKPKTTASERPRLEDNHTLNDNSETNLSAIASHTNHILVSHQLDNRLQDVVHAHNQSDNDLSDYNFPPLDTSDYGETSLANNLTECGLELNWTHLPGSSIECLSYPIECLQLCLNNGTSNATHSLDAPHGREYWALFLVILPFLALFGNILVILSVYRERTLQTVTNWFIVSLAFADLFVTIPMLFSLYVMVNVHWELSELICDLYIAIDVICSTASIFNLVAISFDRYIAVTHPIFYSKHKNDKRVVFTILLVWFASAGVGLPIMLGANTSPEREPKLCIFYNSDFIIYSSLWSFYVPCLIMVVLYYKIFKAIHKRARNKIANSKKLHQPQHPSSVAATQINNKSAVVSNAQSHRSANLKTAITVSASANNLKAHPTSIESVSKQRNANLMMPKEMDNSPHGAIKSIKNDLTPSIALISSELTKTTTNKASQKVVRKFPTEEDDEEEEDEEDEEEEEEEEEEIEIQVLNQPRLRQPRRRSSGVNLSAKVNKAQLKTCTEEKITSAEKSVNQSATDSSKLSSSGSMFIVSENFNTTTTSPNECEPTAKLGNAQGENVSSCSTSAATAEQPCCGGKTILATSSIKVQINNEEDDDEEEGSDSVNSRKAKQRSEKAKVPNEATALGTTTTTDNANNNHGTDANHETGNGKLNELKDSTKKKSRFNLGRKHKGSRKKREKASAKRERKATKTLAIVLGVFLLCWTPFFSCNILEAICIKLHENHLVQSDCRPGMTAFLLTTWLGYMNSCANPLIYTIFNPEFRKAFRKILC